MKEAGWNDPKTSKMYGDLVNNSELYKKINNDLLDIADIKVGETVVDIGCGNGISIKELVRRHKDAITIIGVDPSGPMIEEARNSTKAKNITYFVGEGENVANLVEHYSVDTIISNAAFWQMEVDKFLIAAKQVLAPGGKLVFNLSRRFLDIPRPNKKLLGDYVNEVLVEEHGMSISIPVLESLDNFIHTICEHGFNLQLIKSIDYNRTPEDMLNFVKIPVINERIIPSLSYDERLAIIEKAYKKLDKTTVYPTTWVYFVFTL